MFFFLNSPTCSLNHSLARPLTLVFSQFFGKEALGSITSLIMDKNNLCGLGIICVLDQFLLMN